ncbi:MAG: hypothetical protein K0Q57_1157 [Gammaproteobacteria bacterium]|nr:hypothetical protein [Gammaproteobacteria bacterium]
MQGSKRSNEVAVPIQGTSGEGQPNAENQAVGAQVPASAPTPETRHPFSHVQVVASDASCLSRIPRAVGHELRAKSYWAWGTMALSTAGNCLLLYDASSTSIVGGSLAGVGGLASVFLKGLSLDFELNQRLDVIEKPINKFAVGSALMIPTILQCALEIISACLRLISHLDISKDEFKGPSAYLAIKRLEQIIEWALKHQGPFIRLAPDLTNGIVRVARAEPMASETGELALE